MRNIRLFGVLVLAAVLGMASVSGIGQQEEDLIPVVFQSKWFPQAQFAGYWAAGGHLPGESPSGNVPAGEGAPNFYAEEGLDVTILDGGSVNPARNVAAGNADFGTDWIANVLIQREDGLDLVHLSQVFQVPGYLFVALADSGIETVEDFQGRNVGVWGFGNEFAAQACFRANGLVSDLNEDVSEPDLNTTVYAFDPALVFPDEVDVASAMVYNELDQIIGLGFPLDQLSVVSAAANGCGLLEDFIFTTQELLDSENWTTAAGVESGLSGQELAERFVRASLKGWRWAVENQDQATEVVLDFCGDTCQGSGDRQSPQIHQSWQMARVAEQVQPSLMTSAEIQELFDFEGTPEAVEVGCLDMAAYNRTVELLENIDLISEGVGDASEVVDTSIMEGIGIDCSGS